MFTLIGYSSGIIVEAVVLSTRPNRMRVAVAGFQDALELRRVDGQWFAEGGEPVEFEFVLSCEPETGNAGLPGGSTGGVSARVLAAGAAGVPTVLVD